MDPPKTAGKNARRASLDGLGAVRGGGVAALGAESKRAEVAAAPVRASRPGPPTAPHSMAFRRQDGWLVAVSKGVPAAAEWAPAGMTCALKETRAKHGAPRGRALQQSFGGVSAPHGMRWPIM